LTANTISGSISLNFDTEYTASCDGYVRGIVNNGNDKYVQIMLYFSSSGGYGTAAEVGGLSSQSIATQICSVYVRKGTKYKILCSSTSDATCSFFPLS